MFRIIKGFFNLIRFGVVLLPGILGVQSCSAQSGFAGVYQSDSEQGLFYSRLQIKGNGQYVFESIGEGYFFSKGHWTRKDKVLYLHDSMASGFNVRVVEHYDSSLKLIKINPLKYGDTDVVYGTVVPNGDTFKMNYGSGEGLVFDSGSLKSFSLIVSGYRSKKYFIQDPRSNIFDVYLLVDVPLHLYRMLKRV